MDSCNPLLQLCLRLEGTHSHKNIHFLIKIINTFLFIIYQFTQLELQRACSLLFCIIQCNLPQNWNPLCTLGHQEAGHWYQCSILGKCLLYCMTLVRDQCNVHLHYLKYDLCLEHDWPQRQLFVSNQTPFYKYSSEKILHTFRFHCLDKLFHTQPQQFGNIQVVTHFHTSILFCINNWSEHCLK